MLTTKVEFRDDKKTFESLKDFSFFTIDNSPDILFQKIPEVLTTEQTCPYNAIIYDNTSEKPALYRIGPSIKVRPRFFKLVEER